MADRADDDEEFDHVEVLLTASEVFNSPEAAQWIEADTKERVTLEAMKCWRALDDEELKKNKEIIPAAVIYTRKRCGRFKARLVALGNRQNPDNLPEV